MQQLSILSQFSWCFLSRYIALDHTCILLQLVLLYMACIMCLGNTFREYESLIFFARCFTIAVLKFDGITSVLRVCIFSKMFFLKIEVFGFTDSQNAGPWATAIVSIFRAFRDVISVSLGWGQCTKWCWGPARFRKA